MNNVEQVKFKISQVKNFPPLSEESLRIVKAVNDPDIFIDDLVEVLLLSPAIVARLLAVANSSFFGQSGAIDDIRVAIIRVLGLDIVKTLSLGIVLNIKLDSSQCLAFKPLLFWHQSLLTAMIAEKLAKSINKLSDKANVFYSIGLLLNIGILSAVYLMPKEMNDVLLEDDRSPEEGLATKMKNTFGYTQYEMSKILFESWHLPKIYQVTSQHFQQSIQFNGEEKVIIQLLELSHWLAVSVLLGKEIDVQDFEELLTGVSLSDTDIKTIVTDMATKREKICDLAKGISGR